MMSAVSSTRICSDHNPDLCQQLDALACEDPWFARSCCGFCERLSTEGNGDYVVANTEMPTDATVGTTCEIVILLLRLWAKRNPQIRLVLDASSSTVHACGNAVDFARYAQTLNEHDYDGWRVAENCS